jgi:hypothetical protein
MYLSCWPVSDHVILFKHQIHLLHIVPSTQQRLNYKKTTITDSIYLRTPLGDIQPKPIWTISKKPLLSCS